MTGEGSARRFAQLTYSSFDRGYGGGGWQVKDTSGELTARERELLQSRIATKFDSAVAVPKFPSDEEVRELPRRLLYGPAGHGAVAYWHTAHAGIDSSGRPGNVVAHVVLDRTPSIPDPAMRPTDLWDAPYWRRPFGTEQVLASTLDGVPDPPWSAEAGDHSLVLDFLLDPAAWRGGVLAGLLDAVDAAMRPRGRPVVLGVDTIASAPLWIAAMTHLMSPGTSRRFFWSTHERVATLSGTWAKGVHLAVVPAEDLVDLAADDRVVVIHEDETISRGDLDGEPHRTRAGSSIPVTPWSMISRVVLQDRRLAEEVLELQDAIAAEHGDRGLDPVWPMAMAVHRLPEKLADAQHEALRVLDRSRPPAALAPVARDVPAPRQAPTFWQAPTYQEPPTERVALRPPDGPARVDVPADPEPPKQRVALPAPPVPAHPEAPAVRRASGPPAPVLDGTTATAWDHVVAALDAESIERRRHALDIYLDRAMADARWLSQRERVPLPPDDACPVPPDPGLVERGHEAVRAAERRAAGAGTDVDPVPEAVLAVRLLDLTLRAGLLVPTDPAHQSTVDMAHQLVERVVEPLLADDARIVALVQAVGPVDEGTQRHFIQPCVRRHLEGRAGTPGQRVPHLVLQWLFHAQQPTPMSLEALASSRVPPDVLLVELAAHLTQIVHDPSAFLPMAIWVLPEPPDAERAGPDLAVRLAGSSARDVHLWLGKFGLAKLAPLVVSTLVTGPSGADLNTLVHDVQRRNDPAFRSTYWAATMRYLADRWYAPDGDPVPDDAEALLGTTNKLLATVPVADISPDVLPSLVAAQAVVVIARSGRLDEALELPQCLLERFARVSAAASVSAAEILSRSIDHEVVTDAQVVLAALCSSPSDRREPVGTDALQALGGVTVDDGGRAEPLLDHVVRLRLRSGQLGNVAEVGKVAMGRVSNELQWRDPDHAQRRLGDFEAFARHWWAGLGAPPDTAVGPPRWRRRPS